MQPSPRPRDSVAVVGASGILAPLGALLHRHGFTTLGISRGSRLSMGDWDVRVPLDTHDGAAVRGWRGAVTPDILVAYSPAVSDEVWPALSAGVRRTVVVATSQWSAPDAPLPPWQGLPGLTEVQLGWTSTPHGARWHTPKEVCDLTLAAILANRANWQLGDLAPWDDRPT